MQGHPNKRAIVIGASMGGLLAARVLADYYDQVTVVERDALPDGYEPRKGVPQGRHAHGLLARGREVLEQLFPGFTEEMVSQGATSGDIADKVLWFNHGFYLCNSPSNCWVLRSAGRCWRATCGAGCCNFQKFNCCSAVRYWSLRSIRLRAV